MAPTTATMSSAVESSNGTMALVKSSRPTSSTLPCSGADRAERRGRAHARREHDRRPRQRRRNEEPGEHAREPRLRDAAGCGARVGTEQHDDEDEQHDDGARVDDELDGREKLRVEPQEQARRCPTIVTSRPTAQRMGFRAATVPSAPARLVAAISKKKRFPTCIMA